MTPLTKTCRECTESFLIDESDQAFYQKIGVPPPTLCPDDRQRRRLSFRNERMLYHRKCDLCSKQIISMHDSDSKYTVYCNTCWWSDHWDPLEYGMDFDFSRPFFEQFAELQRKVPRLALFQKNNENCEFTNHTENNKNCYLCIDTAGSQDVFYSKWILNCRDCADSYNIEKSELCYECQYGVSNFSSSFILLGDNNIDSYFLYNCFNCKNCFMCTSLRHREYCIRNQYVGKEAYEQFIASIDLGSYQQVQQFRQEYEQMIQQTPKRAFVFMSENSDGDCIYQCKNVQDSFDMIGSQDCRYCYEGAYLKDCYDTYESAFDSELQYECHGCNRGKFLRFGHVSYDVHESSYVDSCHNSLSLFGCISVRRQKYCILNKVYSKEAYEALMPRIIDHMKKMGEWGEFFPGSLSPFSYNETLAQEYFPLTSGEATKKGYSWKDEDEDSRYQGPIVPLPDNIKNTPEEITKSILKCEISGKLYKIIPQELYLLRRLGIALPRRSPQQRYLDRLALRNPRKLWTRSCLNCGTRIRVPFPETVKNVLCQDCFLKKSDSFVA